MEGVYKTYVMRLRYRPSVHSDVHIFVSRYEEYVVGLYRDSGMWSEEIMIQGARAKARQLFADIYDTIDWHLAPETVMGRKKSREDIYELRFRISNRHLIVLYSEEKQENTRWVESVSVGRKPIIF